MYNKDKIDGTQVFVGRKIGEGGSGGQSSGSGDSSEATSRSTIVLTPQLPKSAKPIKAPRSSWFSRRDTSKSKSDPKSAMVRKPIQMTARARWTVAIVGTIVRTLVHELYVTECAELCNVHSSLFYVDRYIDDWRGIHGPYHIRVLRELRTALLGLYEAHRYFLVWLKDELFPGKSTVDDLVALKPKHILQKLDMMGANEGLARMKRTGDQPDSRAAAVALLNARRDWRAMHGSAVDGVQLLSSVVDAMSSWFMPKLIVPLWRCALSCDFTVQWMKVGVTTKSQLRFDAAPASLVVNLADFASSAASATSASGVSKATEAVVVDTTAMQDRGESFAEDDDKLAPLDFGESSPAAGAHPSQWDSESNPQSSPTSPVTASTVTEIASAASFADDLAPRSASELAVDMLEGLGELLQPQLGSSTSNTPGFDKEHGQQEFIRIVVAAIEHAHCRGLVHRHTVQHAVCLAGQCVSCAEAERIRILGVLEHILRTAVVISPGGVRYGDVDDLRLRMFGTPQPDDTSAPSIKNEPLCPVLTVFIANGGFPNWLAGLLRDVLGVRSFGDLVLFVTPLDLVAFCGLGNALAERLCSTAQLRGALFLAQNKIAAGISSAIPDCGKSVIPVVVPETFGGEILSEHPHKDDILSTLDGGVRAFVNAENVATVASAENAVRESTWLGSLQPLDRWGLFFCDLGCVQNWPDGSPMSGVDQLTSLLFVKGEDLESAGCPRPLVRRFLFAQALLARSRELFFQRNSSSTADATRPGARSLSINSEAQALLEPLRSRLPAVVFRAYDMLFQAQSIQANQRADPLGRQFPDDASVENAGRNEQCIRCLLGVLSQSHDLSLLDRRRLLAPLSLPQLCLSGDDSEKRSCQLTSVFLRALGFNRSTIHALRRVPLLAAKGVQALNVLDETAFADIVGCMVVKDRLTDTEAKNCPPAVGAPTRSVGGVSDSMRRLLTALSPSASDVLSADQQAAPRRGENGDNIPLEPIVDVDLQQQMAVFRRARSLIGAGTVPLPFARSIGATGSVKDGEAVAPVRKWLGAFFTDLLALRICRRLHVLCLSDVALLRPTDLERKQRPLSSPHSLSHRHRRRWSTGRNCRVAGFNSVARWFYSVRMNVPFVPLVDKIATRPDQTSEAAEFSLSDWLKIHELEHCGLLLQLAGVQSAQDILFVDWESVFLQSAIAGRVAVRKLRTLAATEVAFGTEHTTHSGILGAVDADEVDRGVTDLVLSPNEVLAVVSEPVSNEGSDMTDSLTVAGQQPSPIPLRDHKVSSSNLKWTLAPNVLIDPLLQKDCASATILHAWRRLKSRQARPQLQATHMTQLSRQVGKGREPFFGPVSHTEGTAHGDDIPNPHRHHHHLSASAAALRSSQMFTALVRPQERILDFQVLIDRAIDVACGLDHGPIFEAMDSDTRDYAKNIKRVAPGLLEQLRRLAENLTVRICHV